MDFAGERVSLLQELQQKMTARMNHLPGMAYRCRNDRKYTAEYVSEGCKALTGYSQEDFISSGTISYDQLIVEADRERVWQQIQLAVRERRTYQIEYCIRTAEGQLKWVWTHGMGILSPAGAVETLEGFITDITDRRGAEESLRESEMKFRGIFEWAGMGISLVDPEGRILETNPAFRRMLGYSEREFPALRSENFSHPDDIRQERNLDRELLEGRRVCFRMEKRYIRCDGAVFWGKLTTSLVRSGDGKPLFMIRMVEDITAQKRAEEALRESEAKYRLLAENIIDVIWTSNMDQRITYASPSIFNLLGYTVEEIMKMKIENLISPMSYDLVQLIIMEERQIHKENPWEPRSRTLEVELIRKDGSHVWVEVNTSFLVGGDGSLLGISGVARDMTERRRAQEGPSGERRTLSVVHEQFSGHCVSGRFGLQAALYARGGGGGDRVFGRRVFERGGAMG